MQQLNKHVSMTGQRLTMADERLTSKLFKLSEQLWVSKQPKAITHDYCRSRAVWTDLERVSPLARTADVHRSIWRRSSL